MAITPEEETRAAALRDVARRMLTAARTAPKGRGDDNTVMAVVDGTDIELIAADAALSAAHVRAYLRARAPDPLASEAAFLLDLASDGHPLDGAF